MQTDSHSGSCFATCSWGQVTEASRGLPAAGPALGMNNHHLHRCDLTGDNSACVHVTVSDY